MRVVTVLTSVAVIALAAAGCGGDVEPIEAGDDAPAVTAPGTTLPYETGGADGSGADGVHTTERRGGIAAGQDSDVPDG